MTDLRKNNSNDNIDDDNNLIIVLFNRFVHARAMFCVCLYACMSRFVYEQITYRTYYKRKQVYPICLMLESGSSN